jgi:hypothetical protein
MGNKVGYAEVILAALGLRSGQGAERYLWAEADDDVAALLRCYPDASMLRRVAEIIRGWKDEDPRALWERLRAERKARGPRVDAEGVGAWIVEGQWSYRRSVPDSGFNAGVTQPSEWRDRHGSVGTRPATTCDVMGDACHRLAEYATIVSSNRLINVAGPDLMNTGNGGTTFGGEFATPVGDVAAAFERVAGEVAGTVIEHRWSFSEKGPSFGYGGPRCEVRTEKASWTTEARDASLGCDRTADRVVDMRAGWPAVLVLPTIPEAADVAAWMRTPGDLEDCVVYMDPPYAGTTGYAATLGRDEVVRHARAYAELGAVVAISEAEVVIPEWDAVEITGGRRGQKRTFSKQQAEWLTMNREPAHRVAVQAGLFAVGA